MPSNAAYPSFNTLIMKVKQLIFTGLTLACSAYIATAQNILTANPEDINTCIDRFELRPADKNSNGWAHYYIPKGMGDTLTVKMSCVYIGTQTHAPHSHNEDESFYIIKGPVNFHINGEERILNTGDFVYTPSGSSHNIQRVSTQDTIKYLVIKRETIKSVDKPHLVSKPDYTYGDCTYYPSQHSEWTDTERDASLVLLDRQFADGFQVVLQRVTDNNKIFQNKNPHFAGQVAIYIINGKATVMLNNNSAEIETDNTFYCPKGASYSLKKSGNEPLLFLAVTTE